MAQRYARIDVDFFHKNTARKLQTELGLAGPLVFLSLILRAKDGIEPGVFVYRSEAVGWEKLGFDPEAMPFTLDTFFTTTGRLRQTSRKRLGDIWNVKLSHYGEWQQESRKYEAAVKKSRTRHKSTGDTNGTAQGTQEGRNGGTRSRSTSTPKPPVNGKQTHDHDCPECGVRQPSRTALTAHLELDHGVGPAPAPDAHTAYLEELALAQATEDEP